MGEHICTTESFSTGETFNCECSVCFFKGEHKITWVGVLCPSCKYCWDGEQFIGNIAEKRREILKLTRRQIGQKLGFTKNQILTFETRKCDVEYYKKTEELVKKHNKEAKQ